MLERPESPRSDKNEDDTKRFRAGEPSEESRNNANIVGADTALQMALEFVFSVLFGAGAGFALDRWLGLSPLFMVVGLFLGAAAGFWALLKQSKGPPKQG